MLGLVITNQKINFAIHITEMLIQNVALNDVKCFALHGYYPEEQLIGNHYLVSIKVSFSPSKDTEDINNTVNYEVLNDIILEEMKNTQKMLETVVKNMMDRILGYYSFLHAAEVGIKKLHPAMQGDIYHSSVQLCYSSDYINKI